MSYLSVNRGNDRLLEIEVRDKQDTPIDITGASLFFYVSKRRYSTVIIAKAIGSGITVVDATEGKIEVGITNQDSNLPVGDYYYELLLEDVEGNRYTVLQGTLEITYSLGGI